MAAGQEPILTRLMTPSTSTRWVAGALFVAAMAGRPGLHHRRAARQPEAAVRAYTTTLQTLQEAHCLPSTGTVDRATAGALQDDLGAQGGASALQELTATAAVQQTLQLAGFWDGPVDGMWTRRRRPRTPVRRARHRSPPAEPGPPRLTGLVAPADA